MHGGEIKHYLKKYIQRKVHYLWPGVDILRVSLIFGKSTWQVVDGWGHFFVSEIFKKARENHFMHISAKIRLKIF